MGSLTPRLPSPADIRILIQLNLGLWYSRVWRSGYIDKDDQSCTSSLSRPCGTPTFRYPKISIWGPLTTLRSAAKDVRGTAWKQGRVNDGVRSQKSPERRARRRSETQKRQASKRYSKRYIGPWDSSLPKYIRSRIEIRRFECICIGYLHKLKCSFGLP